MRSSARRSSRRRSTSSTNAAVGVDALSASASSTAATSGSSSRSNRARPSARSSASTSASRPTASSSASIRSSTTWCSARRPRLAARLLAAFQSSHRAASTSRSTSGLWSLCRPPWLRTNRAMRFVAVGCQSKDVGAVRDLDGVLQAALPAADGGAQELRHASVALEADDGIRLVDEEAATHRRQFGDGGEDDALLAERRQDLAHVAAEGRARADDQDALLLEQQALGVEQVGRPVQGDGRLAGAGPALDDEDPAERRRGPRGPGRLGSWRRCRACARCGCAGGTRAARPRRRAPDRRRRRPAGGRAGRRPAPTTCRPRQRRCRRRTTPRGTSGVAR